MRKILLPLLCLIVSSTFGQTKTVAIIPEPVSVKATSGVFTLPKNIIIEAGSQPQLSQTIAILRERLTVPTGSKVSVINSATNPTISLVLNRTTDAPIGQEGYRLSVTGKKITISANEAPGLFYGVQSLLQLFPPQIESNSIVNNVKREVPAVEIMDYPRFGWRGLMFDVTCHFFTKAEVKEFIDQMVRYKFNLLHLHLTDDEGWRIQIKSFRKLTKVGAWNVTKV